MIRRQLFFVCTLSIAACTSTSHRATDAAATDELIQASATVTLVAIGSGANTSADAGAEMSGGSASFVATQSGVDLSATLLGCSGNAERPIRILSARNCDEVAGDSEVWGPELGAGIPGLLCTSGSSGEGSLRYSRRADLDSHWTIGDGGSHDIIGHALAVFDPETQAPTACGVIERAADRVLVPLPPDDQAPSADARAQLAGLCLTRLMAGAGDGACIDAAATAACAVEHCELGACLQQCAAYTACLDAADDPCAATFTCEASAECNQCQASVTTCAYGFCGANLTCPGLPSPDGPCSVLNACCALQGDRADDCLATFPLITSLAGEGSCVSALADWDVISHTHVPCETKTAWDRAKTEGIPDGGGALDGTACVTAADCEGDDRCVGAVRGALLSAPGRCLPRATTVTLDDHIVGTACTSDAACGNGQCELQTPLLTDYPEGYCSTRCYDDATCGAGGVCLLPKSASDPGHCLQACESDTDCARGHYRCTPLGDGERVLQVCYPREPVLPDHVVGTACQRNAECGSASCLDGMPLNFLTDDVIVPAPGGYCSGKCLYDEDCGAGAQCISGGVAGGQCMAICDDQAPCRDGYRCVAHLRDADPAAMVCMPIWD